MYHMKNVIFVTIMFIIDLARFFSTLYRKSNKMKVLSLKTKKKKTQLRYLFDFNKRRSVQNKILKDLKLSCNIT